MAYSHFAFFSEDVGAFERKNRGLRAMKSWLEVQDVLPKNVLEKFRDMGDSLRTLVDEEVQKS